ncbi:hypothetical protein ACTI_38800 [Actinoplanes sp. OR16]|nr:hypothetical protein ACTI_38800 [Actinoplanes sp. OR16]
MPVAFGPRADIHTDPGWLLPGGLGGYAMGTVTGLRTRRYTVYRWFPGILRAPAIWDRPRGIRFSAAAGRPFQARPVAEHRRIRRTS